MAHIIMINKPYIDKSSVKNLIKYATTDKTKYVRFMGAIGTNSHEPEEMIKQFMKVKKYYEKTDEAGQAFCGLIRPVAAREPSQS